MLEQLGLLLVFAGLGFKIAAAPSTFTLRRVRGVIESQRRFAGRRSKIAGFVALIRLTVLAAPSSDFAWQVAMVMAALTMTIGNVCALWQNNLRRLMAYSSIAHAGYMLIGISVALAVTPDKTAYGGVSATVFYLLVYVLGSPASSRC